MHYPQWPCRTGWDVNATFPVTLADDWQCSETGMVRDIHFWGSWLNDEPGTITSFTLSIHADIPDPDGPDPLYSMPGEVLWLYEATDFASAEAVPDSPAPTPPGEGWYDPSTATVIPENHVAYYQYHVYLPPEVWFEQEQGTIYWLNISAHVVEAEKKWGWKSSKIHWNDDAVWGEDPTFVWVDMFEPPDFTQSLDLAFVITNMTDDIPAVSEWGLLVMVLLGLTAGTIMYRKFRAVPA